MGQFYFAAKAFDVLERLDPNPEYWEGKRGACVGVFQLIIAGHEPRYVTDCLHLVLNICTLYSTSALCTQHLHLVLNICTWYSIWCRLTNCNKLPLFATNLFREIYLEESINWCVFFGWKALDILPDYEINRTRKLNFLYLVHVFTPN